MISMITLLKRYTQLNITDYVSLLHLTGEYRLAERMDQAFVLPSSNPKGLKAGWWSVTGS